MKRNYGRNTGASYVWRVEWYDNKHWSKQYRSFKSKQAALIFESKLRSNYNNYSIYIEKYSG
jgi:hypothetical protein